MRERGHWWVRAGFETRGDAVALAVVLAVAVVIIVVSWKTILVG